MDIEKSGAKSYMKIKRALRSQKKKTGKKWVKPGTSLYCYQP